MCSVCLSSGLMRAPRQVPEANHVHGHMAVVDGRVRKGAVKRISCRFHGAFRPCGYILIDVIVRRAECDSRSPGGSHKESGMPEARTTRRTSTKSRSIPVALASSVTVDDQIRNRAQELFETRQRTGTPGDALSDWLQAEREILVMNGASPEPRL